MKTHTLLLASAMLCSSALFGQRISFSGNDSVAAQIENQRAFRHMPFQFTLLIPPLSTNGIDFYKTVNDISVNTFLGVSAGTEMIEAAGFTNVNLYYTHGIQAAGFANITGLSGSSYESAGVQAAGFANVCGTNFKGIQASGFANLSKEISGLQASGFMNVSETANNALQATGFANITLNSDGVFQAAGFANAALKGESKAQFSGFGNIADEVNGIQAAGFVNIARKVKGVQLSGFINICDSIDGVPIGIISYVRKNGYRSYGFSFSEWAPIQFTFKMGVKKFYNIYTLSKLPMNWDKYAFGFGFGHAVELGDKAELDLEVVDHHVFSIANGGYWNYNYSGNNQMIQFKPAFKREIGNGVCLNFGPTLNFNYGYYTRYNNTNITSEIQPLWKLLNNTHNPSRFWVGFSAGISLR